MTAEDRAAPPAGTAREPERDRIRRGVLYCLVVFLALRVALGIWATLATAVLPAPPRFLAEEAGIPGPADVPGWPAPRTAPGLHNAAVAWERFDALWFLRIADSGYRDGDGSAVFLPGYPLLIRGVSALLGGRPLAAGLLVSNLAFLGALIALYFLTASERGERAARRSVLYLSLFPTAFFFLAPYSESPFLLFSVVALWGARRRRWAVAALAGAAAAATRNVGILLALPLAIEGVQQWRETRRGAPGPALRRLAPAAAAAAAVGLGAGAYLLFWKLRAGDWMAPVAQQANWERELSWPWGSLWVATREAFRWIGQYPGGYHLLDWLIVVPALGAGVWVALRARLSYAAYTWASLLVPLSFTFAPRPLMSMPRFLIVVFPLVWAAAAWAERRRGAHEALVAVFALGLGLTTVLFVNWYFVF